MRRFEEPWLRLFIALNKILCINDLEVYFSLSAGPLKGLICKNEGLGTQLVVLNLHGIWFKVAFLMFHLFSNMTISFKRKKNIRQHLSHKHTVLEFMKFISKSGCKTANTLKFEMFAINCMNFTA